MRDSRLKSIQMVDLKAQYLAIKDQIDGAIEGVIGHGSFINGPEVGQFSQDLGSYLDSINVVPCGNGTDALQVALMALGLRPGDEVILPAFTYIATAEVIALLGLKPVFADVDPQTFNVNVENLENSITANTKAIMVVHLFGQGADLESITQVAEKHELAIIEDNAQSLGADYTFSDGTSKKLGTVGLIGTTSFFPSKVLGCYGDGGAIFCQDTSLGEKVRKICNHGQSKKYYHDIVGVNSRLDTLQAAVLIEKLKKLPEYIRSRREAADYYDSRLATISGITIPFRNPSSSHVFHQYTIKVGRGLRDELRTYLNQLGVPSTVYYPVPMHLQKGYAHFGFGKGDFPIAELLCQEVLSLPIHTEMAEIQLNHICNTITQFYYE